MHAQVLFTAQCSMLRPHGFSNRPTRKSSFFPGTPRAAVGYGLNCFVYRKVTCYGMAADNEGPTVTRNKYDADTYHVTAHRLRDDWKAVSYTHLTLPTKA